MRYLKLFIIQKRFWNITTERKFYNAIKWWALVEYEYTELRFTFIYFFLKIFTFPQFYVLENLLRLQPKELLTLSLVVISSCHWEWGKTLKLLYMNRSSVRASTSAIPSTVSLRDCIVPGAADTQWPFVPHLLDL